MIVVDSSVWIGQLRSQSSPAVAALAAIQAPTRIIVGDLVLMEVLRGARDERHAESIERAMRRFKVEPMVDEALAIAAARHSRILRQRGVTLRKTIDLLIATYCIERGHTLLHQDRDFDMIARHLPLAIV
ncbi:DNA-binding protein [Bosea sp. AAP35]|uniref:type II toxin-antitoxin system VapC family toxin n=1 Tax=Bosea sp. AAP35 TaxID=1523417 RepID=UPI0006B8C4A6|nr:PIN domain nuclease [Bosea sp. AAP35]KPF63176.1 DNA-binding protein [Bosea sp. AAP35]